ncbi:MAG TPA: methylmalonyl-CoA mutase family protein [Flavobacteriales bacterium]|nr:methylmalonyl-CoA mutase family protein [Flavobacteriales bacterium]
MPVLDSILKEFPAVDAAQWTNSFLKETKQENFQNIPSVFGFEYKPFYGPNAELDKQAASITSIVSKKEAGWNIAREFSTENAAETNKYILQSLEKGVSSITLVGKINSAEHIGQLLNGVLANFVEINFKEHYNSVNVARYYYEWIKKSGNDADKVFGTIHCDGISGALAHGGWSGSKEKDLDSMVETFEFVAKHFKKLHCFTVNAGRYHYAGANLAQTLSFTLSHAVEYLNYFKSKNIDVANVIPRLTFYWPVGIHFFGEVAALRALHYVWNNLCQHITGSKELFAAHVYAEASSFWWSVADKHNNLLRSTTQAMAAVAGGSTSVHVPPYNVLSTHADQSAERLATNIQLLLREESFMDKVNDPSGGSYLVENLTAQLAEAALTTLKAIEKAGGHIYMMEAGKIQDEVKKSFATLTEALNSNKLKVVGLTLQPNKAEKIELPEVSVTGNLKNIFPELSRARLGFEAEKALAK